MSLRLSDEYLIGFVEGEGTFYVGVVPSRETKSGWQVIHFFKVSQNPSGKVVLDKLRKRLDCGYIRPNDNRSKSDKTLAFVVRDLVSLRDKVVPFFDNNLMIKRKVFESFKKVVEIVDKKRHLSKNGIKEILDVSYSMNTGKRKFTKSEILNSYK